MTDQGSSLLRIQGSSRLAFGATTVALVAIASGGTALLVNQGSASLGSPTSLPAGSLLPDAGATDPTHVVVERAPGTALLLDPSERALRDALGLRPQPGRRTLTAPLVAFYPGPTPAAPALFGPAVPPSDVPLVVVPAVLGVPEVSPTVLVPPDVGPPVVVPPVVVPPVVVPPAVVPPAHGSHSPGPTIPPVVAPPVPVVDPLITGPSAGGKGIKGGKANGANKDDIHTGHKHKGGKHAAPKGRHTR